MTQLIIQHQPDGSFVVIRQQPDFKAAPVQGRITPPSDFAVDGTPNAFLAGELRWLLEDFLDYPFPPRTDQANHASAALQAWGAMAFKVLFDAGQPRTLYDQAVANGLDQFKLLVSSDDPKILAWPWEALYDPQRKFIAQSCDIERKLNVDVGEPVPLPDTLPKDRVNILLVTCRPKGDRDVGYRSISRPLVDLVHATNLPAEVTVLRPPTFEQLEKSLQERPGYFHVLHFDGHGAYGVPAAPGGAGVAPGGAPLNPHTFAGPQGFLVFEKTDGTEDLIAAATLDQLLLSHKLPAVVLNACQSAMVDGDATNAFASVAASLVHAGVRSVVAMSYSLYVTGAQRFLPAFYAALFRTGNFATATRAGRRAMLVDKGRVCAVGRYDLEDWIVPVLYQQQPIEFAFAKQSGELSEKLDVPKARATHLPEEARLTTVQFGFVGRDFAILELERALLAPAPVLLIHGLGGIGKTTLARGFADWLDKTNGLEACCWISFEDTHSAESVLHQIGDQLGLPPEFRLLPSEQKADGLAQLFKQHRILLIWDNFESASGNVDAGVSPLLKPEDLNLLNRLLAGMSGGHGKLIMTSRSEEGWLPPALRRKIELGGLRGEERWEFVDLIAKTLGLKINREDEDLVKLLDLLEGHPLLMRVVLPELERTSAASIAEEILKNGLSIDDRTASTLQFVEDRLPDELKSLLIPLALHERFVDADYLEAMADQLPDPKPSRDQIDRFCRALATAGLLQDHGQNIYQLHPALTRHLQKTTLPNAQASTPEAWERAFVDVMGRLADHYAPKELYEQRGVFGLFEASFRAALDLATRLKMSNDLGALTQSLAAYALNTRRWEDAAALFQRLADYHEARQEQDKAAAPYHQLGIISQDRRDFDAAEKWYLKSLAIKEKQGNEHGAAITYQQLGLVAHERRDFDAAEKWYLKSLAIKEKQGNERGAGITYHQLGIIAQERRDFDAAEKWYLKSLAIKERQGNEHGAAGTYHQLGIIAEERRDFDAAEKWSLKSLAISEKHGNEHGAAMTYHQLGIIAQDRRDFDAAEKWYLKSLAIKERQGNEHGAAGTYHQLGMIAQDRRDFDAAEKWYLKSLAISEKQGNEHYAAITYHQLGLVAHERRDFDAAEKWYLKSLAIKAKQSNEHGAASTYHQLGLVAHERRDFDAAEKWYLKALAIKERQGNEQGSAMSSGAMGLLHAERGDPAAAVQWLIRAARGFKKARDPEAAEGTRRAASQFMRDPAARALWPTEELGALDERKPETP